MDLAFILCSWQGGGKRGPPNPQSWGASETVLETGLQMNVHMSVYAQLSRSTSLVGMTFADCKCEKYETRNGLQKSVASPIIFIDERRI